MDLFASDEEIVKLEEQLGGSSDNSRFELMVQIAWFSRQSNTSRALALAEEINDRVGKSGLSSSVQKSLLARAHLVIGESHWLLMAHENATHFADLALQEFGELDDSQGKADAHWLLAWVAVDAGDLNRRDWQFRQMAECAELAHDIVRLDVAHAALARWAALNDARLAQQQYGAHFKMLTDDDNSFVAMWSNEFLGVLMYSSEDLAKALSYTISAHKKAIVSKQVYFAIVTAANIAETFGNLNEHLLALDWIQRGLNLARQSGWPRSIGNCLITMSGILRQINNISGAREVLNEALTLLAPIQKSRSYALALNYQGSIALDQQDYEVALDAFRQLEIRARELQQSDFRIDFLRGQAHALSFLGQPGEAIRAAQSSLTLTQKQSEGAKQIEILMLIADIYYRHPDLAQTESGASSQSLDYLYQALGIAEHIPGYIIPSKLYEMLSVEYAAVSDFKQAFLMADKAIKAKEKIQSQETVNRASNIQILHEIERVREDSEYHRQIALSEAKRSKELLQITTTLEQLGAIGREITTHLDQNAIFQVLNNYVHALLDVNVFKICLVNEDKHRLDMVYCIENDVTIPFDYVDIDSPSANSARCFREGIEIVRHFAEDDTTNHIPGTLITSMGLYFPLMIGERKLGIMAVESLRKNAFGQREQLIFRSLCAYAAIGFDNSQTYQQLQITQKQLVYHEKMAALGSIVAGVAHELNTPIGNGMLLASSLRDKSKIMTQKINDSALRRSELVSFLEDSERAAYLIFNSFQTAADLVMSFKQVSVDQTTAHRRSFDLKQLMEDIIATMKNQFTKSAISIELQIPEQLTMNSFPGPLGQVIMNLMQNALLHAFEGRTDAHLTISGHKVAGDRILIRVADDGNGISRENLGKIFDPFFTTKLGSGGSGLGLSISYNIVKSILRGDISVESQPEKGTTFSIELPLVASS